MHQQEKRQEEAAAEQARRMKENLKADLASSSPKYQVQACADAHFARSLHSAITALRDPRTPQAIPRAVLSWLDSHAPSRAQKMTLTTALWPRNLGCPRTLIT